MMRIFNRLHKAIGLLEYFSSQDWEWNSENLTMLLGQLTPEDRKVSQFGSNMTHVVFRRSERESLSILIRDSSAT